MLGDNVEESFVQGCQQWLASSALVHGLAGGAHHACGAPTAH